MFNVSHTKSAVDKAVRWYYESWFCTQHFSTIHLTFQGFTRLNKLGITMACSSKLRLQDECAKMSRKSIVTTLASSPLVKLTGDNLDIYIKTGNKAVDTNNKDLHMFATNLISTRLATSDMDNKPPPVHNVFDRDLLLSAEEKEKLKYSYTILVRKYVNLGL